MEPDQVPACGRHHRTKTSHQIFGLEDEIERAVAPRASSSCSGLRFSILAHADTEPRSNQPLFLTLLWKLEVWLSADRLNVLELY